MDVTAEALAVLQETAQKAMTPEFIDVSGDGRRKYLAINGKIEWLPVTPGVRRHTFCRLDDLIEMALLFGQNDGHPVVWHDQNKVVLVLDDTDRRDIGVFPLQSTDMLCKMTQLEKDQPLLLQKELIRLLRVVFELDPAKIAIFRRIDWSSSTTGQGTVERGRESLGRQIEQKIVGAQEIPETITIPIALYRNVGEDSPYAIRCLVDFDIDEGRIQIIPAPGEIDHALFMHQMSIGKRLENGLVSLNDDEKSTQIYFGTP